MMGLGSTISRNGGFRDVSQSCSFRPPPPGTCVALPLRRVRPVRLVRPRLCRESGHWAPGVLPGLGGAGDRHGPAGGPVGGGDVRVVPRRGPPGLRLPDRDEHGGQERASRHPLAVRRGGGRGHQRLRPPRWPGVLHPRDPDPHEQRGGDGLGHGPRDRPHHRPALRPADDPRQCTAARARGWLDPLRTDRLGGRCRQYGAGPADASLWQGRRDPGR